MNSKTKILLYILFIIYFDIVISLLMIIISSFFIPFCKKGSYRSNNISVLRVLEGGSIEQIYQKFSNLNQYENFIIEGYTKRIITSTFYIGGQNFLLKLKEGLYVKENNISKLFILTSLIRVIISNSYVVYKYKVDIIHSVTPFYKGILAYIISKITRRPFCLSIHSDYDARKNVKDTEIPKIFGSSKISEFIERFLYKKAILILPRNEPMAKRICKIVSNEKVRLYPQGVEPFTFSDSSKILNKYNLNSSELLFVSALRFDEINYPFDYLSIMCEVNKKYNNWLFLFCGDGHLKEDLIKYSRELNIDDKVIFTGFISNQDIIELKKNAFCNLCLVGGYSLIESALAGKVVVSYDVEWHKQLIIDESYGILIMPKDYKTAANRICECIENNNLAVSMGNEIKSIALEKFSIKNEKANLSNHYNDIMNIYFNKDYKLNS